MYKEYFKLKERPFSISPDPRYIYLTSQHEDALAKCEYAISQKMGALVIYGDIGAGKTSMSRHLWGKYDADENINFSMVVYPSSQKQFQFLNEIRREFGLTEPRRSFDAALENIREFLIDEHHAGKTNVLVVDEAQTMTPPLFEVLRQLLNFETNTEKLLQIVLFGQTELAAKIDRMPEFKDRVTIFGALTSLTRRDSDDLISFRWRVAGGETLPFPDESLDTIFRITKGSPRKICKLCDNVLIHVMGQELQTAEADLIRQIASELRFDEDEHVSPQLGRKHSATQALQPSL
jgi:general secretion pathway protein A